MNFKPILSLFFAIACFSCSKQEKSITKKVNAFLYQNRDTNEYYYSVINEYNTGEMSKAGEELKPILDINNQVVKNIDLNSFKNAHTFWYDKTYIFHIERHPGYKKVIADRRNRKDKEYYFHNSYYRIRNGNLEYYGHKMNSDSTISCPQSSYIVEKVIAGDFFVLQVSDKPYGVNAIAVYNDKYLFNGCWLNINGLGTKLRERVLKAVNEKKFVERVEL